MNQLGLDYASVDEDAPPDFAKARAAKFRFAYLRRSYCYYDATHRAYRLAHDPVYARDAQRARDAGLVVGAYLFPIFDKGAPSPAEQVGNFLAAGGAVIKGEDLPVALDVEFPGRGIADTCRTQAEVFGLVLEFVRLLKQRFTIVAIYTSHVQWHDTNGLGGPLSAELDDVLLWIKTPYRLTARSPIDTVTPTSPHANHDADDPHDYWRIPAPWAAHGWWVQQYQGDAVGVPGFNKTADLSIFPTIQAGSKDAGRVSWVQRALKIAVTSVWDPATEAAVRALQTACRLEVDGIIGVQTFAVLAALQQ